MTLEGNSTIVISDFIDLINCFPPQRRTEEIIKRSEEAESPQNRNSLPRKTSFVSKFLLIVICC